MYRYVVAIVALLAACTAPSQTSTTPTTTQPVTTTTAAPPDGTTGTSTVELPVCLAGDAPFVESGSAGLLPESPGDVAAVGGVTWRDHGQCEQLVVDYRTQEGAPAVDPPTVATLFIRDSAVLRLNLDATVTTSGFQEQVVDTPLVTGVFSVRTPAGSIFLDVHLAQAAVVRVSNRSSPARTVVDLRPGGPPLEAGALRSDELIVVEPVGGQVAYPFSISGYTLRSGNSITATLTSAQGDSVEATADVADRYDTWGSFTLLFPDGPAGPVAIDIDGLVVNLTASR